MRNSQPRAIRFWVALVCLPALFLVALLCAGCATKSRASAVISASDPSPRPKSRPDFSLTLEEVDRLKKAMHSLHPHTSSADAERVLGVATPLWESLRATCGNHAMSENYFLRSGTKLFLWRERTSTGQPSQLISATLFQPGQPDFTVWVKSEIEYYAELQTNLFAECKTQALDCDEPHAITCLLSVTLQDYPGVTRIIGSPLEKVVQASRQQTIVELIAHLRNVTGLDLGELPEPWIELYARELTTQR